MGLTKSMGLTNDIGAKCVVKEKSQCRVEMTVLRPFHEERLWKGEIQKAKYPAPTARPLMILPYTNWLTGIVVGPEDLGAKMNGSYAAYSEEYWKGVRARAREYRIRHS